MDGDDQPMDMQEGTAPPASMSSTGATTQGSGEGTETGAGPSDTKTIAMNVQVNEASASRAPEGAASKSSAATTGGTFGTSQDALLQSYRVSRTLGIGSFGKVKIAEHILTGHKVAVKVLNRKKIRTMDMEEKVRREIKILRLFRHPHIIKLYEVIETKEDIFLVMEYVKAGELFDYIVEKGRIVEDEARRFFQQIISGVEYCHRNMVVHRDLKPENLLLDSRSNVKLADFGLSNVMRDGHLLKTSCGSPNYAAPEVISGKLYAGPEVDVWSCGVILYALLCGSLPFDDENIPNLFRKIKNGLFNLPNHLSPHSRDLIAKMLVVDPLKRITIPEIRQHVWFAYNLPRYLAVGQPETILSATKVDPDVLSDVVRLGYDREGLQDSLARKVQDKAVVTYFLVLDNRLKPDSGYMGAPADISEIMPPSPGGPGTGATGAPGAPGTGRQGPPLQRRPSAAAAALMQQRIYAERRWRLGLQCEGKSPREVIELTCAALASLGARWKKIGPYCLKARWELSEASAPAEGSPMRTPGGESAGEAPSASASAGGLISRRKEGGSFGLLSQSMQIHTSKLEAGAGGTSVVKMEIQLYKLKEGRWQLDFQKVQGGVFPYLDICSALLDRLSTGLS